MLQYPKISVIIPVYNTEPYIKQCLDSVLGQTVKELEIICIDNGSTDNSYVILKEYEDMHSNITVLQHSDGHQGAARNAGLKIARGEYIGFVDSDDFIAEEMFEEMYNNACLNDIDIVICNINLFFQKNNTMLQFLPSEWFAKKVFKVSQNRIFFRNLTICNKLFKRSFLEENKIAFPEEFYHEDQVFVVKAYTLANKIVALQQPFYFYRKQRDGSVSQHKGKNTFDIFQIMKLLDDYFKEKKLHNDFGQILSEIRISRYIQLFHTVEHKYKKEFFMKSQRELLEIDVPLQPIISSRSEYKDFKLIRNNTFWVCMFIFFLRNIYGKIIYIPILGPVCNSMKNQLSKSSV